MIINGKSIIRIEKFSDNSIERKFFCFCKPKDAIKMVELLNDNTSPWVEYVISDE